MRRALPLLLVLTLVGCKGNREKEVVGTWKAGQGTVTITEAKTFTTAVKTAVGEMKLEGPWTMEGNDITLSPKTLNGRSIADLKPQIQKTLPMIPADKRAQAESFVKDLDTPNVLTLSDDGKTLTTNKEKDKNSGPAMTLTKG